MAIPHISSFCCCFGLEQGTKLIGYLHTIFASILVIYTSYLASEAYKQVGTIDDIDQTYSRIYRMLCVIPATGIVHIVLGAVLLYGAYKRKTSLLRAWVFLMSFLYVCAIVFIIAVTIAYGTRQTGSDIFIAFVEGVTFFVFMGYAILCVNSFYLLLKSDEDMCGPKDDVYGPRD